MEPWIEMRDQFPVADELAYLNHAAVAPHAYNDQRDLDALLAAIDDEVER